MRAVDAASANRLSRPPGRHRLRLRLYWDLSDAAPTVQRWTGPPPTEATIRGLSVAEGFQPSVWENGPGDTDAVHEHGYMKILRVVRGSIRFDLLRRTESIELGPGDTLTLPAGVAHSAVVGPDGVTCLAAHRPIP